MDTTKTPMCLIEAPSPPPTTADDRRADILSWRSASSQNTIEAYQGYLEEHPNGAFAAMAENRIKAMIDTPEARAERAEQALDLSRDARRAIQRDLSLLGYNTRGIDGIFGRGTRAAITAWQEEQRYAATGYLSREEIEILSELAAARAEELEAEAERRRQEQLAADIAYWDQTGSDGTEEGLRQYLNQIPRWRVRRGGHPAPATDRGQQTAECLALGSAALGSCGACRQYRGL